MTMFRARRRAERFDTAVDTALRDGSPGAAPPELAELVSLAASVARTTPVAPRPEFAATLREQLMTAAATELAPAAEARSEAPSAPETRAASDAGALPSDELTRRLTVGRPGSGRRRDRRIAVAIGAVAIVGATSSMAVASQNAMPGDTLYPVKRAVEDVRTTVTLDDQAKGERLISQADRRLAEIEQLTEQPDPDPAAVSRTLTAFTDQAEQAGRLMFSAYGESGDPDAVNQLRTFTATGLTRLAELAPGVPEESRPELGSASRALIGIDHEAGQECPECAESGIADLPSNVVDLLASGLDGPPPAATSPDTQEKAAPGVDLPSPDADALQPGSITDPSADPGSEPAPGTGPPSTGPDGPTGDDSQGTRPPEERSGSTGPLGGLLDPDRSSSGPSDKPSTGLGKTVDDTGDSVDGLLDGVLSGLNGLLGDGTDATPR